MKKHLALKQEIEGGYKQRCGKSIYNNIPLWVGGTVEWCAGTTCLNRKKIEDGEHSNSDHGIHVICWMYVCITA